MRNSSLKGFALSWALALAGIISLLSVTAKAERLPLKAYTTADGLAHNTINRIVRDSRGFLWFCTNEGLSRFDGYTFTNFGTNEGLPHPTVTDILETRAGDYWVATNGGLCKFNPKGVPTRGVVSANNPPPDAPKNPMFTVFTPAGDDRNARAFTALLEGHDGTIWGGTWLGLLRLAQAGGRFELQPVDIGLPTESAAQRYINTLLEDRHGTLWIGTNSGLYRRWPEGSAAHYSQKDGLPERIHDLLEDRNGKLWVGTGWGGLLRLAIGAGHDPPTVTRSYNHKNGFATDWIFDLFESADGRVWVGTNVGLIEFPRDEERQDSPAHVYAKQSGFSYQEIMNIAEDRDGNLWLGTVVGAMKMARSGFITYDIWDGLDSGGSLFESSGGELYVCGTVLGDEKASVFEGGKVDMLNPGSIKYRFSLGRFDGQRFTWLLPNAMGTNGYTDRPFITQARTGEWWFGMDSGLYLLPRVSSFTALKTARPVVVYTTKDGLASPIVYSIYEDSRGDLWISTFNANNNGLARWEHASRTIRDMAGTAGLPSLKEKLAASFAEDRAGNVWVGFNQGELARYADERFTVFTPDEGLARGRINDLYLDHEGRLWVATSRGGVSRIDEPQAARPTFVNYSTAEGLSSDSTTALTEDLDGRIYVGTGRGVDQITPTTGRIKHFTTADGLAGGEIFSAIRDRSGMLWFSTRRGLSRFLPEREHASAPPPILISGLSVAGARQNVSALGETHISLPELAALENQLQIAFVGLSFAPGEVLRYQYRLEGADSDWSAPTEQRTVNYAQLAPGRYRFLVRAVNSDGVLSASPAVMTFRVLPHVYQRWWFITLVALTLGLITFALYRYRVARLVELERVRTRIAADLHDDIGSSLSQISVLSEVLRKQLVAPEGPVSKNLHLINRVSHEALESMSDIVWAINPLQDHLSDLVRRMRRVASEVLPACDIEFTFSAPVTGLELRLGADIRREVFLMFKETLNNIVRHSGCARADIELKIEKGWLVLVVADNGKGFEADQVSEGNGLVSLRRRARSLGGETVVASHAGAGTAVTIRFPHRHHKRLREGNGRP